MDTWYKQYKTAESYWTVSQVYTDDNKISYDVELLIQITQDHKTLEKDSEDLKDQLSNNSWGIGSAVLTPMMVIDNPEKTKEYRKHFKRIKKANLKKPILIREDTGEIIDGYHRLSKAVLDKQPILYRMVTDTDLHQSKVTNFAR